MSVSENVPDGTGSEPVRGPRPSDARPLYWAAGSAVWIGLVALLPVLVTSPYYLGLAVEIGIMTTVVLGLIVLTGFAGQFSLGQAAFFGLGAYSSGILTVRYGVTPFLALLIGGAIAGGLAFVLGRPIFRLRGHFLAMGTLALNEILYLLFNNLRFTGGSSGFGGIQAFVVGPFSFDTMQQRFYLVWIVAGIGTWFALRLGRSREGRALIALRGHETAASACGVHLSASKTRVFVISAVFGAVGGSLYAHDLLYVNPPPFALLPSIMMLVMAVVGGLSSAWGALVGAVILTVAHQGIVEFLPRIFGPGAVGAGEALMVGAILLFVLVFMPRGVVGALGDLRVRLARSLRTSTDDDGPSVGSDHELDEPRVDDGALSPTRARSVALLTRQDEESPDPEEPILTCTDLTKRFGGVVALDALHLQIRAGEILGIIGPNGAGKSTLINILSGVLPPSRGQVTLADREITGIPPHRIAELGVARTFQTPSLFRGMSVRNTVMVGTYIRGRVGILRSALPTPGALREERAFRGEVDDLLDALGLTADADRPVEELPLGYQKLVEIARALAARPRVLLLDEPAAGLNRAEKQALRLVLERIRSLGVALVLVEHDMELVMSLADRVHVINFGQTLREGTPAEVQDDPAVIEAYLGVDDDTEQDMDTLGLVEDHDARA